MAQSIRSTVPRLAGAALLIALFCGGSSGQVPTPESQVVQEARELLAKVAAKKLPGGDTRSDPDSEKAIELLVESGQDDIQNLIRLLDDQVMFSPAYEALRRMGPAAQAAVPVLVANYRQKPAQAFLAVRALAAIGLAAQSNLIEIFRARLASQEFWFFHPILDGLIRISPQSDELFAIYKNALQIADPAQQLHTLAVRGLSRFPRDQTVAELRAQLDGGLSLVRITAAEALGSVLSDGNRQMTDVVWNAGVERLKASLKDNDDADVRASAARALRRIDPAGVMHLVHIVMGDPNVKSFEAARIALNAEISIRSEKAAIEVMAHMGDANVAQMSPQTKAAIFPALVQIAPIDVRAAKTWVPAFVPILLKRGLSDGDATVQLAAAQTAGRLASLISIVDAATTRELVDRLLVLMKAPRTDHRVSVAAAIALGSIGEPAGRAVDALIERLNQTPRSRWRSAAEALGRLGKEGAKALVPLAKKLRTSPASDHAFLAHQIGSIVDGLQDSGRLEALTEVNDALAELAKPAENRALNEVIASKDDNRGAEIDSTNANVIDEMIGRLKRAQDYFNVRQQANFIHNVAGATNWVRSNAPYLLLLPVILLWVFVLWLLHRLAPLQLLRLSEILQHAEVSLPWGGIKLPARAFTLVSLFHHRPHVIDAWVASQIEAVRQRLPAKATLEQRRIHVPSPVLLQEAEVPLLAGEHLRPALAERRRAILIWGEGGSGKTSLACQIALWAIDADPTRRPAPHLMLPVLIEDDFDATKPDALLTEIQGQVQDLIGTSKKLSIEFIEQLARRGRLLVIVDHLSEMTQATRDLIDPTASDFPISSLVVTSRMNETLGNAIKTAIQPMRVSRDRLAGFFNAYVSQKKAGFFRTDADYFRACQAISEMVGDRDTTILFVKLFADQLVEGDGELARMPRKITDLMLGYVDLLNRQIPDAEKVANDIIRKIAAATAWQCLKSDYRPSAASRADIIAAISGDDAEKHLRYLEKRLVLLKSVPPIDDQYRWLIDPLAEYLAGVHLVNDLQSNELRWRRLLDDIKNASMTNSSIRGFLSALRDCCSDFNATHGVPIWMTERLSELIKTIDDAQMRQQAA